MIYIHKTGNEYGKVRTDRVIVPTGMPPEQWAVV